MRCTVELALLASLVVAGCGAPEALPPAGAEGGVLRFYRGGGEPTRIAADLVRQDGPDPRQLSLTGVRAHIPLSDGACHLRASGGRFDELGEVLLSLDGPIQLHGWGAGGPFTGHAAEAEVRAQSKDLHLRDIRLVQAGQEQRIEELVLPDAWGGRQVSGRGSGLSNEPAGTLWTAALAALPPVPPAR